MQCSPLSVGHMKTPEQAAYHIPLTTGELALLGEVVVIIGQIDDELARSLTGVLSVDRSTANSIMRGQDAIDIWAGCMQGRCTHPEYPRALSLAVQELKAVQRMRNDFVHADYRESMLWLGQWITVRGQTASPDLGMPSKVVASRTRDQKKRDSAELQSLREKAARASRLIAHVAYNVAPHGKWDSPWYPSIRHLLQSQA